MVLTLCLFIIIVIISSKAPHALLPVWLHLYLILELYAYTLFPVRM